MNFQLPRRATWSPVLWGLRLILVSFLSAAEMSFIFFWQTDSFLTNLLVSGFPYIGWSRQFLFLCFWCAHTAPYQELCGLGDPWVQGELDMLKWVLFTHLLPSQRCCWGAGRVMSRDWTFRSVFNPLVQDILKDGISSFQWPQDYLLILMLCHLYCPSEQTHDCGLHWDFASCPGYIFLGLLGSSLLFLISTFLLVTQVVPWLRLDTKQLPGQCKHPWLCGGSTSPQQKDNEI